MKRTLFFAMGALAAFSFKAAAQDIDYYTPETTEGVVYLLPKTMLEVNVIATQVTYTPGELCQYANRYLKMNNVNPSPETHWKIKQIDVRSIGVPDKSKAYIVKLKDKSQMSNVTLTDEGVIKSINIDNNDNSIERPSYKLEKSAPAENTRKYMTEDILMAGSTAKMAELTAKEIYNIRDSKNLILRGQADTMPKDGASLKLIIDNLDKQEKALTEMFSGSTITEDKLFTVRIAPTEDMKNAVALRFSSLLGIVDANNLSGEPIYISVNSTAPIAPADENAKKKKRPEGAIYNIPGKGKVTVSFKGKNYFSGDMPITQFGSTEVLTTDLFNKKLNTRVIFNPETGGIMKIDKD